MQQQHKVCIHAKIMTRVAFNACKEVKMIDNTTEMSYLVVLIYEFRANNYKTLNAAKVQKNLQC